MRTLLVNPPYPFSEIPIMPMGLSYLGSVLEHSGHEVQILDLLVSRYSKEKIKNKLDEYQPDIVGVTSVTLNYPIASEILKYAKSLDKDITTIIGGPHVTFAPVETLTEAPWIDIVVKGEGEMTMLDIVSGKKLADIDGIAYRDRANGIKQTRERRLIEDLDELPPPAKHLFPLSRYLALDVHASILTGRGCPFNCIFCVGSKMGGRRVRYRNPKLIVDEVEQAVTSGFTEVNFEDDHLTLNHKHLNALCDEIIARGLKFNWSAFSRVDTVNSEILRKMKQAGCTWLLYGVESGNQEILDTIKKKITLQKVKDAVDMAKEAGIGILASFIVGLPGETVETLRQTMQFAQGLGTSYGFNVLSPFPGTEVREKAAEYGVEILTNDWTKYDCNRPVTRTKNAGPKEINAFLQQYFEGLNKYLTQLEKESRASQGESAKGKRHSPLSIAISKGDVIESLTMMEPEGNPVEALVSKVAELVPYSRQQVKEDITKWVDKGLLKCNVKDGHLVWDWT
jgi:anaerobic magnesium-protoporphyrin IX monomethyl ester cyclase